MMSILRNSAIWSWVFFTWTVLLVVLNIIPNFTPESLQVEENRLLRTDYIEHFISFLLLTLFYFLSDRKFIPRRIFRNVWLVLLGGLVFSVFVEVLQIFVPGRTFNPVDMGLNISGLLCGIPVGKAVISLLFK